MGDGFHFVYDKEAQQLATMPLEKLDAFVAEVKRIRISLDTDYAFALKKLGEE